jgi:nucleoside-diphosphate-sugar epimerase
MTHVLVTGATGFLGAPLRGYLARNSSTTTGVDVRPADGVRITDISDPEQLDSVLNDVPSLDSVVHLAAAGEGNQGLVAGAATKTAAAVRVNIEGFIHILEAAARHGAKRVVWSSSTTVYGPASTYTNRVDESASFFPTTAYGATKAACEYLGPIMAEKLGIDVVALRLPMVYGPGRWYGGSQAPLVALADALKKGKPIEVGAWSGDADWVHVSDVVTAIGALLTVDAPSSAYHIVGHRGPLSELATAMLDAAGNPSGARVGVVDSGAPNIPAIDDSLLRRHTAWAPTFSNASSGARDYLRLAEDGED